MKKRNTIQKELVLNAVHRMRRHVTAEEIYEFIRQEHPTIGKGTVYRNLGKLSSEGNIRRIEIPDGPDRYDYILQKHYHVRCIECGKIYDVDMEEVADIKDRIHDLHGFTFLDFDILFKGICPDCGSKERRDENG